MCATTCSSPTTPTIESARSSAISKTSTAPTTLSSAPAKSGGQKEKLAYTILAAALAYQFGLGDTQARQRHFRFVVIDEAFGRGSDDSTRYGLELFRSLDLQLLIVTPLQKIAVIEDYIAAVHFVHNEGGSNSVVQTLTIEQYRERKEGFLTSAASHAATS